LPQVQAQRRHDGYVEHVDRGGEGDVYAYRIVPLPLAND
jgi:hypothetical protein